MKRSFQLVAMALALTFAMASISTAAQYGAPETPAMKMTAKALEDAMGKLGVTPDTPGFMVLTNAGYGQADGKTTEAYLDLLTRRTGRTPGARTLLAVNTPCYEPLWFALFRPKTHELIFLKRVGDGFEQQEINIAPERIFTPEAWAKAAKGLINGRMFSVTTIALSWAEGAGWTMLKASELHDHFCPGLNAGFIAKAFIDKNLPLGPGDYYVFVGAPPICAMDALQSAYGRTAGKRGVFTMMVPEAAKKRAKDGVAPTIIAMRINDKKDVCDGVVIGFDWNATNAVTGVDAADLAPPGGKANPLFFISRAKMSWKLAQTPMDKKSACIKDLGRFSGPASLAKKVESAGADPYAALPK